MPANRIERDYDKVLGNFRRDFSSQKGESIRKMRDSVRNIADISVKRDASTTSLNSIASNGSNESRRNSLSDMKTHGMCVSFSELSPAEARDLRAWNMRLDREEVFNQSYKPMQEELKELKSIEKDLVLKKNDLGGLDGQGQESIRSIFFPRDDERKSVLLKRGPILLYGEQECEIMLFTNGFLLRDIKLDSLVKNVFAMNALDEAEEFTSEQLCGRFDDIDVDGNGSLDVAEIRQLFLDSGTPVSNETLDKIMEKLDGNKDGCITFDEFETAMQDHVIESKFKENKNQNLWQSLVGGRRKSLSKEPEPVIDRKIYSAYTFSNIEKVECVNLPESDHDSPLKDSIFVIYIKKIEDPLVIVCLKPLQCDAWLDAFHKCLPAKSQDKKVQNANLIRAFSTIDWGNDDSDDDP